jgi:hypothetical protein
MGCGFTRGAIYDNADWSCDRRNKLVNAVQHQSFQATRSDLATALPAPPLGQARQGCTAKMYCQSINKKLFTKVYIWRMTKQYGSGLP